MANASIFAAFERMWQHVVAKVGAKADKSYVDQRFIDIVNAAPETLDTLGELAQAFSDNATVIETLNQAIGDKASKAELQNLTTVVNAKATQASVDSLGAIVDSKANASDVQDLQTIVNNKAEKSDVETLNTNKADKTELVSLTEAIDEKVDKVEGKVLSSNDYTNDEKAKLASLSNYTLPNASTSTKGGVTIGDNISVQEGVISISAQNVSDALGYTPAEEVEIDTSLKIAGAAADAKAVGDAFDSLDKVIVLDENADGNIELRHFIIAEEGEGGYTRLDSSLTVAGMAPDSKAVGDAINLRMMANAIIPIAQGGTGATTAADARAALGLGSVATLNTIPVAQGGTGATTAEAARTALGITPANIGAAESSHNHAASNITSGTLGVARGGTGKATHTSNAILTGNGTSAVNNVATASGAFYATAANGAAKFGTLPIAQGGTGATTGANALKAFFAAGNTILSSYQYGTTLPAAGNAGRIFFKKV